MIRLPARSFSAWLLLLFAAVQTERGFGSEIGDPSSIVYTLVGLTNQIWKYEDSNTNLGTAWRAANYNDTQWKSGRGLFAFEDNPLITPLTNTVLKGVTGVNDTITCYFRLRFVLTNDPATVSLISSNYFDDGAVVYLNGVEVWRYNLPAGNITSTTLALAVYPAGEGTFIVSNVPSRLLVQGTNFLAVEVHQNATTSSDVVFGMNIDVRVSSKIVILEQPASATVLAGTNVIFQIEATGAAPLSYQWLFNGTNLPGATSSRLELTNAHVTNSGAYSLVITNQFGAVTSAPAMLIVRPFPPDFIEGPISQVLLAGATTVFSVQAIGAPILFYQWYFNDGAIPGATNAVLSLTNLSEFEEGRYRMVVSNTYGVVTSGDAILTVNHPPRVTNTLSNVTLPAGTNWIFRVSAQGDQPLAYQWQFEGVDIAGATNTSFVLGNIQKTNAGRYAVTVGNDFGIITNVVYSVTVIDSPPVIFEQPVSQTFRAGDTAILRALAYGTAPTTVQWWRDNSPISGATNQVLLLTNFQSAMAGTYFATISNAFGSANSALATLAIGESYAGEVDWPQLNFTQVSTSLFSDPTCITHAGDGSGRLFVVEQAGRIRVVQSNNAAMTPMLDIGDRVMSGYTRGLLSMVFPPGSGTKDHFYVNYTRRPDVATVISRFRFTTNSNVADPQSEEIIKVIPKPFATVDGPFATHNAGQLAFGPDGYLYIGTEDGGYGPLTNPDAYTNAQSSVSLRGKLLRIDVEGGASPYRVPTNNPFVTNRDYAPEIWALGLRNPWRFSFDRLTGDLFITDQYRYGEIDFQPATSKGGENYGWPLREGPAVPLISVPGVDTSKFVEPVSWNEVNQGPYVIGGYVYRGPNEPRMNGIYFLGDYEFGRIWGLKQKGTNWQRFEIKGYQPGPHFYISTFGEDEQGRLFFADYYIDHRLIYRMEDGRTVWTPRMVPSGGFFINETNVFISSPTPGVTTHYTTDLRDPTEFDPVVPSDGKMRVAGSTVLKLRSFRSDLAASEIVSTAFVMRVENLLFSPAGNQRITNAIGVPITNGTPITISSATAGAALHYTTDGSDPSERSPLYRGPVPVNGNTLLRARGFKPGFADSGIESELYSLARVETPLFDPPSGPITNGTVITISSASPGSTSYYTTNGATPDENSLRYRGPFSINGNSQVKAISVNSGFAPSAVKAVFYVGIADSFVDSDHDGMTDAAEVFAGTDPLDSKSFLAVESITILTDGRPQIRWRSVVGKTYLVKYSDDPTIWNVLGSPVSGNGSVMTVVDPTVVQANSRRVYRVFLSAF